MRPDSVQARGDASLFLSCDWGTSSFRLRLASAAGNAVLAEVRSDAGTHRLSGRAGSPAGDRASRFRQTFLDAVHRLARDYGAPLPVHRALASGMAGSSVGWREVPYAPLPFGLDGEGLGLERVDVLSAAEAGTAGELEVFLVSGVAAADDVMRGEECEVMGLAGDPALPPGGGACLLVLPGTHSKHMRVEGDRVTGFRTLMTGELLEVLGRHSLLRHSVDMDAGPDAAALAEGARVGARNPLAHALFRVRTRHVLGGEEPASNHAYLAGVLVGSELAAAHEAAGADTPVVVAAGPRVAAAYRAAAEALELVGRFTFVSPERTKHSVVRGHALLARRL